MSRVLSTSQSTARILPWQLACGQCLEERHVCAWSPSAVDRDHFVHDIQTMLSRIEGTEVCRVDGQSISTLAHLTQQLADTLNVGTILPSIDGRHGLVDALRRHPARDGVPVRRRCIIWTDAHVLLRRDHRLFGRVIDAIMGVSGEGEFVDDDVLLLQRLILVGRPALDLYAEDPKGQLCSWYSESGETPFWKVITGLDCPPVARWRIGQARDLVTAPATSDIP